MTVNNSNSILAYSISMEKTVFQRYHCSCPCSLGTSTPRELKALLEGRNSTKKIEALRQGKTYVKA